MIASVIIGALILTVGFSSAIAFAIEEENTVEIGAEEVMGDDCNECQTNAQNIKNHASDYLDANLDWEPGDGYYFGLLVDIITIGFIGAIQGYNIYGPIFGFNAQDCNGYMTSYATAAWNQAQTIPGKVAAAILGAMQGLLAYLIDLCDDIDGEMLPASAPGETEEEFTMESSEQTSTSSTSSTSSSSCGCEQESSTLAASEPVVREEPVESALR